MPTNALIDPLGIEQSDPLNIESGQGYRFPTTPSFTVPVESGRRNIVPAATEPDATQYPKLFIPPPTASEISLVGEKLKEAAPPELTEAEAAKQFRESVPLDEGSLGRPIPKTFRLKTPTTENMRNQALTELGQNYLKLADTAQTFGGGLEKAFSGEGGGLKALPFIGAIASVPQQKLRNELLEKVKSGTPLNDTEKSTVDALLLAQRRIYQPEKFWEKVGELTGGSAPYALEFALSAGAYSWAKTAAGRWLLSVPGDALAAGLARGAGVAAQTAAGGIPRVASEYLDRMAPKWSANPKDFKSIIFDEEADKNWLDQLTKSFGSQFIENLSERLSGPIGRGGDVLMDKLGAKRLLARSVRLGAIQDALNKGAAKNFMDAANKMKSAAGFTGGITGEVLEEYAGNGLKSLSGVDTQNSVPQELWKGDFVGAAKAFLNSLPVKDTPAMAVSFGIIPAGQHAVGLGLAGAGKMAEKLDERRQEKAFDLLSADVANRNALEGTMPAPAQGRTGVRPFSDVEQLPASAVIPEDTKFPTRVATGLQTPTVGETQNIPIDDPRRLVVLPKRKAIRRANSRRITLGEQAAPALATSPDSADIDRVAQWIANQDPNAAIPPERMVAEISKQYQYTKDAAQAVYNGAVQQLGIGGQNASGQPSTAQVGVLGQGGKVGAQAPLRQPGQASQAVPQAEAPSQPQVSRNWLINITPPTTNAKGKALPGAVQIDMMRGDVNERGSNPDELRSEGYDIPNKEEFFKLPKGRYTLGQALDLLAQQANQAQKGVTPNGQEEEGRQALLTKLSPDAFLHPSGAPNGARAKVRWAVVSASQASPMVNRTINEFQPSQREGDVEAKELRFKIGSNPDTSILFESTSADRGAPTIDAQAMRAVAGNTRLWGLIDGYKAKTKGIRRYRGEVLKKAAQISPQLLKQAESIEDPILVLMADAYEGGNRSQFVVEANQSALQREDSVTQSVQDARALGDLTRYSFTAQGLLTSQSAQVAAEKLQAAQRQKEIRTRSGTVDLKKLSARVQRAAMSQMAQQAGMDAADLIYLFESEHGQRVVGEVVRAAPLLAKLEGDLNLGVDLIAALRELQIGLESVRDESSASLDEWQKNRANELAGVRNQLSQEAELLLAQMVIAQRKPKVLREVLETYANTAAVEQKRRADAEGGDLTGEVRKPITGGELVRRAIPAENQAGTAPSGGGKSQPSELKETAALIPGESMGAELDRLLKLRDTLGKGTKEIAREAKRFLAWLAENRPDITRFDDIKNSDLIEYAATGVQSGRTIDANSRNKYLRFVAQVLEWLSPDHPTLLQLSKSMAFEPAKAPPRVEGSQGGFFKPEATAKLVAPETSSNAYRIRDKAFFALMRYTGFRVEDVLRLKLNQIDLERGIIKDALISKRNVILPMRAIPELAIFNIRRYLESGARGMLGDAKSEYLFPGTGKKGFTTVGNMLLRIQKMAKEEGVTLANDADAQTKAFRATFAQDLVVGARLDKQTVNELSGRVGEDVTESNYLSRHSDSDWIENVNRPAVSALPENRAFVASQQSNSNPALPKADASTLQWRQRKAGERDLSAGLSGKRLARYNQLRDRTNLTPAEQAELEALSNVNQQPLFGEDIESEIQSSAAAKAAELRRQADENDRLGNLRLDAWASGERKARGEADAYFNEAERLRKLARDIEPKTRKQIQAETPDLFGRNLSPGQDDPSAPRRKRIGFNPSENGFTVTYSQNPFGQTVREIRSDNLNDMLFLVSHPSLTMDETLRSALKGIVLSGVLDRLPLLHLAITDFIEGSIPGQKMYRGEYIQSQQLARLWNLAGSVDAAHEVLHHIHRFLSSADRDWIRVMRIRAIAAELKKSRNYAELGQLEKLLKEQYSSDGFSAEGFAPELYHLANEYEFFAWMMQDRAAQYFTRAADVRFIDRIRSILRDLFYSLRKMLNLTSRDEEIWQQIIKGDYQYDLTSAKEWANDTQRNLSVPTEEVAYTMGDRLDPETAWAQIESASRLAIPATVKAKLDEYNGAITELESREYDTQRYKQARKTIQRLVDEALIRAEQSGAAYWQSEENLPSFSDENLGDKLEALGINFDKDALAEMQKEIRFERRARTLASWRRQLEGVNQTIATFQSLGWNPEDYDEFTKTAARLTKSISRYEFNPDRDNAQMMTVSERAIEIETARANEPALKAKRDALNIPMVNQIFVEPNEAGYIPSTRLTRTLQGFEAAMNSGDLNENYKDAIAKETWDRVVEYETAYNLFNQWKGLEVARVSKQLRTAKAKLADAKMDFGLASILADESARVGNGERGLTGSLLSREAVNFLNDSFGTLMAFARSLRTQYPNGGAEPVLMRILAGLSTANPGTFTPESSYFGTISRIEAELAKASDLDLQRIRRSAGVADYALSRILYVLARSDNLESAVGAMLRYGERESSGIPANQLDRITALLDSGDELAIIEGKDRLRRLAAEARNSQALLSREMKSIEREISDAEVALMAIDRGEELFQAVQDSPQFHEIRKKVVEWLNLRQEMIADTGGSSGDQRGVSLILKKFSLDAAGVKINREEDLVINAADEVYEKQSDFLRIQDWYNDAKRYVIAFREADTRNRLDPENNRTPEALGFDRTIYNGLEDALRREGRFQDTGILFLEGSLQHNVFQQWLTGMSFFRQFLVGLKMANGQAAKSALSSAVSYGNALNISKTVYHRHKFTVQRARLAALKSHPEFKNDLELYRDQVFNEMAAEGRQFGETLKAGMTLPVTGHVVTKEDISYLVAVKNMSNDYMRNVSERFSGGILEERGHEKSGTRRVFRRRAASVGEYGLPMQLKESAKEVLRKLTEAYAKRDERPTAKDDLTRESQNKAVRFWNRNIKYLTRHILDSGRQFRTIEQDPDIMRAEQRAAAELRELNNPKAIQSVDDAVALIAKYLPRDSGRDVREWAASGLLAELEQYFSRAEAALPKAADVEKSQGIGGITARSEFSTAAAQFNFPSNLYEYGAVTNRDMLMQSSRVMHEPIMELNRSMERVQAAISSEIDAMQESASLATNYSNVKEALRVRKIIQGLIGDLAKSWNFKDSDVARHGLEMPPDIIKSALLAGLTVNIRNIITGGLLQFNNIAMLDRHSRMFALLKALRNVSAISARVPLELMFGQDWPVGRYGKKWIIEPMRKLGHPLTQMLLDRVIESELPSFIKQGAMTASRLTPWAIVDAHNDYVAKVQQLGFSLRDPQWEALKRMVGDTNVHQTTLGGQLDSGKMSTVRRAAGNVSGAGSLFFRGIGAEYFDKIINAQSLAGAAAMERLLCELSEVYGESRKGFGEYNPADARWRIAPEDYSKRLSKWGQQQNLAAFLDFMAGADLQVESLLWNYYTQMQAFRDGKRTEPSMLTDDQFDALRAAFIRAMNAGDALNRPASLRNSRLWRVLATFQGYVSNYLLALIGLGNGVRSSSAWSKYVLGTQMAVAYAFSSTAIILISNAATDWWKRHMQGAAQRQVTILTREFWTDANKSLDASTDAAIASVPFVGDLALFIRGSIVNNRGYEPTGRVLAFSLLNDAFATTRGVFNLVRNDPENALNPIRDMILKYVGLGKEVAYATSPHYQAVKDFNAGQGVLRYQNEQAGFLQDKEAGNVKPGQYYSPTSGIREDLKADMVAQDQNRLSRDFKKLVDYYTSKGLKNPQSVAVNDFKQMHPAVQAMGGKKPTTEQYDSVYKGLSDAQRASVDKSVAAWNWGAKTLGINYSPFASVSLGQVPGGSVPRVPAARRISIGSVGRAVSGIRSKLRGASMRLKTPRRSSARRISLGKRFAFRRPVIRRPRLSLA